MVLCTYFLRGQCRFGSSCRNEHPQSGQQQGGGFGNTSWTNPGQNASDIRLSFSMESMGMDLTPQKDKPIWPLSCYGPAKYEPNLISGLDESQEELRFRAVTANQSGKITEYMAYEKETIASAEQTIAGARNNLNQAFERAVAQSTTSPQNGLPGGASAPNAPASTPAFGNTASANPFGNTTSTSTFGNPTSAFGSTATPFGKPAFGQPAFGQSAFGQTAASAPAFGQPASAFGQPGPAQVSQPTNSAFGQSQSPTSGFVQPSQPSSLIKPATGAFGASNAPSTNAFSAFSGQPTAFGSGAPTTTTQPASGGSVFGQPAFGAPTTTTQPASGGSVFGQPAFGATAPNQPTPSAFSNPSTAPGTSAFGGPVPSTTTTSAFGAPSAFGSLAQQPPAATSAFGTTNSPFGANSNSTASAFNSQPAPPGNAFNNTSSSAFAPANESSFPGPSPMQSAISQPPLSAFPMASPTTSFGFNSATQSQPLNATTEKGHPDFSKLKSLYKPGLTPYDQILPPDYLQRLPESALKAFQSDKLEWDNIPDWIPPLELR